LKGEASTFNIIYSEGHPLTIGIVVSVNLREGAEVMLRLNQKINMNMPIPYWDSFT